MPRTRPIRPALRLRAAALLAALALAVAGCSALGGAAGDAGASSTPSPRPLPSASGGTTAAPAALRRFYDQRLTWRPCRTGDRCARLRVPLDYAHPDGRTLSLALLDVPAGDPEQRVGSLVVNPGGPGASGVDYAADATTYFGPALRQVFDIVGFDPRGVGRSDPLHCASTQTLDRFVAADPDPDTPAEVRRFDAAQRRFGEGCLADSGSLTRHISTVEAARDMDVLRAALGEPRLTYFGASYGTFLGATYAGLFPHRVGRMVLDGAIDPSLSTLQMSLVQARGFEVALRSYVKSCVDRGGCFLGSSVDAGITRIQDFLAQVERHSLPATGGRRLAIGNAVYGVWLPLYNKSYWPILDNALKAGFAGDGGPLLTLSDAYVSRGPTGYTDNLMEALYAVNCLDHDDAVPSSKVASYLPRFEKASPTFGAIFAYGLSGCASWPVHTGRVPAPIHAPGAPPILVVGTTRDPATPLAWARALAHQLDSGVLVTRNGDGHTGYREGNACVDRTVESYLVSGTVPKREVHC